MAYTREEYRAYMRKYMARFRKNRRAAAIAELGGKCLRCGTQRRLEFDHIDRSTKFKAIGRLAHAGDAVFWREVRKCELLCHSCHREKSIECGDVRVAQHGSHALYKRGCRCSKCRGFVSLYMKALWKRKHFENNR